jgi:hypothetical protein
MCEMSSKSNYNSFYVGNIGAGATDSDLKEFFASQGITAARVVLIKSGYAFVYIVKSYSVESVLSRMRDTVLPRTGRTARVEKSFKTNITTRDQKENPSSAVDPWRAPFQGVKRSSEKMSVQANPIPNSPSSIVRGAAPTHVPQIDQNPYPIGTYLNADACIISQQAAIVWKLIIFGVILGASATHYLTSFAALCLKPVQTKEVMYMLDRREKPNWFEGLSEDHITIVTVNDVPVEDDSGRTLAVRFMVLPSPYKWPTFLFDKNQRGSCGQSIILLKESCQLPGLAKQGVSYPAAFKEQSDVVLDNQSIYPVSDVPRFAAQRLLLGNRVVLSGHPGVGKSAEINVVLFYLLCELVREHTALKQVFFRIARQLYIFYVAEGTICCEVIDGVGDNLVSLSKYMETISPVAMVVHTVLVLEMHEKEDDPEIAAVPVIIALASRDLYGALKTLYKSPDWADVVVRPPHAPEALLALAMALYQAEGIQSLTRLGLSGAAALQQPSRKPASSASPSSRLPSSSSKSLSPPWSPPPYPADRFVAFDTITQQVRSVVRERIHFIGPLARQVLNSVAGYNTWKTKITAPRSGSLFLAELIDLDVLSLPENAEPFVASYTYESVRFLSAHCSEVVRKRASRQYEELLGRIGLDWQMAETVILEYFVMKDGSEVTPFLDYQQWEFFRNPELNQDLTETDAIDEITKQQIIASCIGHKRKVSYAQWCSPLSAIDLDSEAVYVSTMATMPVGEYFTYDADTNLLTLFQTSTVDPQRHPFSIKSLRRYSQEGRVSIRIMYFVPWHKKSTRGVHILNDDVTTRKGFPMSDEEVCEALYGPNSAGRYSAIIIRCGTYSREPCVLLRSKDSSVHLRKYYSSAQR